jgi:hypothetical protein
MMLLFVMVFLLAFSPIQSQDDEPADGVFYKVSLLLFIKSNLFAKTIFSQTTTVHCQTKTTMKTTINTCDRIL